MKNLLIAVLSIAVILLWPTAESCKTSTGIPRKAVKPSTADSLRLATLEQEILLRVRELGTIVSRNTGCKNCTTIQGFEMKIGNTAAGPKSDVVILNYGGGVFECHKDPPGICCECPCP